MPISNYPFRMPDGFSSKGTRLWAAKPIVPIILYNPHNDFNYSTWAIVDTGADTSVIPEHIAKSLYHDIRHPKVKRDISFGIGGAVICTPSLWRFYIQTRPEKSTTITL